jgi:hypothetical protein
VVVLISVLVFRTAGQRPAVRKSMSDN